MNVDLAREPLFAQVLARPDDIAPRLVLADRLTEQGDPRGEFIQLQCAIDRNDGETHVLEKRADALLKKNRSTWIAPLKERVRSSVFRRGFVEEITTEAPRFLEGIDDVFSHTPLRCVRITAISKDHLARIAKSSALLRLNALGLAQQRLRGEHVEELCASEYLASLRALEIDRNPFGARGFAALARSPHLAQLRDLSLSAVDLRDDALAPIVDAPFAQNLERLALFFNYDLDASTIAPLVRAPLLSLRSLDLSRCPIGDEPIVAIAASPRFGALTHVRLIGCGVGERGAAALMGSTNLRSLNVVVGVDEGLPKASRRAFRERFIVDVRARG